MPSSIATHSLYAAAGLAVAMAYLLLSTVLAGLVILDRSRRAAGSDLRHAPGEFLAREVAAVERRLRREGGAVLLFATCLGALEALGRPDAGGMPAWAPWTVALLTVATGGYAAVKAVALLRYRARLLQLLEASRLVAQRLDEVQRRGYRVFHAVQAGNGVIDHVAVGTNGAFAIQVIVPERADASSVAMARSSLRFAPAPQADFALQPLVEAFARLTKQLGHVAGRRIKVVPVLVAMGCRVEEAHDPRYILTNEQNCVMLVGWKDSAANLMDDEVARISEWLNQRCLRPRRWYRLRPRVALHPCVTRPGLL